MSCELVDFIMQEVMAEMRVNQFSEVQIEQVALTITPSVTEKTLTAFGGGKVYIPKRMHDKASLSEILANQFTGNNIAEIARDMKVDRRTVYRAIKMHRIKKMHER